MTLRLTVAFSDNPRVQPLKDGTVKPQNIELDFITLDPSTLFYRNLFYDEFDASEMSISETLLARERTDGKKWDWSALPVFLSRGHHWPYLYVNTASGIASLADISGKRIGVPDYDMTAALWFRITLKDLYGIEARDNVWFNGRTEELSHGGALGLDRAGPVGVEHHWLTADQTLDVMLDRGEIDACTAIRPDPRHGRRSNRHRPLGGHAGQRQSTTAQTVRGRWQSGGFRILPQDRFLHAQSPRDRSEPHLA
jgi:4,5-dihydroxyphthalate decarboxylase